MTRPKDRPIPARIVVFGFGTVGQAEARRNRAVIAGDQAAYALPPRTVARENQRARIVIHRGIRRSRREVRVLVAARYRRQRELVAQAVVDHQLAADAQIVLRVESPVAVNLPQVANRLGRARVAVTEQKRREGAAAGGRGGARDRRLQEAEARLSGDVLLAEAVGFLVVVSAAELEGVRSADVAEVVLECAPRLLGAVIRRAAPRRRTRRTRRCPDSRCNPPR